MNILLITTIGGFLPKFLMQDVRMLQEMGYTVHYASNFDKPVYECDREELEKQGIICHPIPIEKSPLAVTANLTALRQLSRLVKEENIRIIHCHNPVGGVLGRMTGIHQPYIIYTAHGFHFYKHAPWINWMIFYPVERLLAYRTDQLITINHEDKAVSEHFRLRKNGCTAMIPGVGLDTQRFTPDPARRQQYREALDVEEEEYLFLSVGELNGNKNHETVIRAFAKLDCGRAKLIICGEGIERKKLECLIGQLSLSGRILLPGYCTEIERYYRSADCFLFPSVREGLGMAALEAMACGLPVIAGDNRGTREYVFDNGILCKPKDIDAYTAAMKAVMEHPKQAAVMGKRSREIALGFSRSRTDKVMRGVYERMKARTEGQDC